jgi:anti-sigma regulatory factor (Ser/Thr protein kinase)
MKKIASYVKNEFFLKKIETFCKQEDFELIYLNDKKFEYDHSIIVIITDDYDKLKKINFKDIPICIIEPDTKTGFRHYSLDKNFDLIQFRELVDSIYHGGVMSSFHSTVKLEKIYKKILIGNDIHNVDRIVNQITSELVYFFPVSEIQKIRIGVSEILTNAIEHGNLAITGDEKFQATENEEYENLLAERLKDKKYSDRKVVFEFTLDENELKIYIEDEGDGFNVEEPSKSDEIEDLLKLHGRGILITKMYFDEIIYNEKGNAVTLLKRI